MNTEIQSDGASPSRRIRYVDDLLRLAVIRAHLHVQRRRIEGDSKFGGLGGLGAFARLALDEVADDRRAAPDVVAEGFPCGSSRDVDCLDASIRSRRAHGRQRRAAERR